MKILTIKDVMISKVYKSKNHRYLVLDILGNSVLTKTVCNCVYHKQSFKERHRLKDFLGFELEEQSRIIKVI